MGDFGGGTAPTKTFFNHRYCDMFGRKSHGWFWYAFWSLVGAACIYLISRFFLGASDKLSKFGMPKAPRKGKAADKDELYI